jgi:small conductance mechanosensitive channel
MLTHDRVYLTYKRNFPILSPLKNEFSIKTCRRDKMDEQIERLRDIGDAIALHGRDVVEALIILVVGLIVAKMLAKFFRGVLEKLSLTPAIVSTVNNIIYVVLVIIAVAAALNQAGMDTIVIRRILLGISLAVAGLIVIFRPLIPTLPFKVGNTVEAGGLLGKVEATTVLNTRMRTFDGKTVFVPNSKILNDNVINYHFTPNRRIYLDVGIGYDQDLLKAKQVLETIMIEDPRVLATPRPIVYVVNLGKGCVELSGRCWVENLTYWRTRCELLEKIKLRFDQEGITIAFPQLDVHFHNKNASGDASGQTKVGFSVD